MMHDGRANASKYSFKLCASPFVRNLKPELGVATIDTDGICQMPS